MTRETKIGLLVGLAFIIVIGILLSDHMTSTTEPAPASLSDAGSDVRKTVTALAPENPPVTTIVTPQSPISPRQPVPIQAEAGATPRPAEAIVRVGPGNYVVPPAITIHSPQNPQNTQVAVAPDHHARSEASPAGSIIPQQLQEAAREQGEQLVPSGPQADRAAPGVEQHEYIAQAGDSVSRMAARLMGVNNRPNREAIVKANPSLQQDPNKVIVGRKYVIPAMGGAPVVIASRVPAPVPPPAPTPAVVEVDTHINWYTVKANDSLWRIAEDQLGDAGSVAAIKDLNKDVLKGSDGIRPGMRLRLPAKSVASAQ